MSVVVTDVGGNHEHVTHGVEGYLSPRGDDAALALNMIKLLQDPHHVRTLGAAARQRVINHFDLHQVIATYSKIYESLWDRRPACH